MEPQCSLQDVIRCDLCETPMPPLHCVICHIHLCEACEGEHLSDKSKKHYIVPFKLREFNFQCLKHSTKICKTLCEECNALICATCNSSKEHKHHKKDDILKVVTKKEKLIRKDLQELEKSITPMYQEAATNIPVQRAYARNNSKKLTTDLDEQGKVLHIEIDTIIRAMKSEIDNMDAEYIADLNKQENAINHTITEIKKVILDLKSLLNTSDVCLVSKYTSKNEEFRSLPAQFQATLPTFTPQEINREQIQQQIGSLSKLAINYPVMAEPQILTAIQTKYKGLAKGLQSLSCPSSNQLWTCGNEKIMRLYNLQGKLLREVETLSGNKPKDIAVTKSEDLVYVDNTDRSLNLVSKTHIRLLIKLQGWVPLFLCKASSGDLLVIMDSDKGEQTKVVRYSGSTEIQSIQWDDQKKPLYSFGPYTKYLSENKNLDVCVADSAARAVVVVTEAGKLHFKYTGSLISTSERSFKPVGISTDSKSKIVTADEHTQTIHIIDQDGQFLRYIDNCNLKNPRVICVDSNDNLFVGEFPTGIVKKIQCYK
uniref:Uncharacterized protein LOC111109560 n=1 Tax=Crassostrea virginica TaxID=6565 RepID=A0A8B8BDG4_CRAVI|nr:uncharacterized protein LOC111109560 [Crassostrea virginica]